MDMAIEKQDLAYIEKGWPIMRRAIDRIEMLVLNMLAFSRGADIEISPMDLNALVEEVLNTVRARAEHINVHLEFDPAETAIIEADSRGAYRVLLNLITNALDACEANGGTVTVRTYANPGGAYVEVKDTGCGIPSELMPKLSEAFVSTKGGGGTGLGLACSYKIVHDHGGTISVESEPGKGAIFTVFLPARGNTSAAPTHLMQPSAKKE